MRYLQERAMRQRTEAQGVPIRNVTRQEFIDAILAAGGSQEDAEFQAKINKTMEANTVVGDEALRIVS